MNEEIAEHTSSTCDLSSQRNTIRHLPPELLTTIFICYASDFHKLHLNYHWNLPNDQQLVMLAWLRADVPLWVNVSYVCRYWRAAALDCPTLWGYHFVVSQRWTEELLARSQQASLKICVPRLWSYDRDPQWSPVEKLMDHSERIQALILHVPESRAHRILSRLFESESSRAPRLQSLEISIEPNRGFSSSSMWNSAPFHGDTPALRTLGLSNCPVPWYSMKLSGLTKFSLHDIPPLFQRNMEEFLAMLSCMQDLTYLSLCGVLPGCRTFMSSTVFNTFQKINLPHLSHLSIAAPLSPVIAFLSCVNIPREPETELRLECRSEDDASLDDYALLSSLLAQRLAISEDQTLPSAPIRSLIINFAKGGATFAFSTSERYQDSCDLYVSFWQYWDCNVPLKVELQLGQSWSHHKQLFLGHAFDTNPDPSRRRSPIVSGLLEKDICSSSRFKVHRTKRWQYARSGFRPFAHCSRGRG